MFAIHNETLCEQMANGDDETGRVVASLKCYCEHVPAWVSGEAFLSPSATILLAILAVVLFSFRQLIPLFFKVLGKLFERVFGAVKVDAKVAELVTIFTAFEQLAPQVKEPFQFQLRHILARESAAKDAQLKDKAEESSNHVVIAFASMFLEMPSMVVNLEEEQKERCVVGKENNHKTASAACGRQSYPHTTRASTLFLPPQHGDTQRGREWRRCRIIIS